MIAHVFPAVIEILFRQATLFGQMACLDILKLQHDNKFTSLHCNRNKGYIRPCIMFDLNWLDASLLMYHASLPSSVTLDLALTGFSPDSPKACASESYSAKMVGGNVVY